MVVLFHRGRIESVRLAQPFAGVLQIAFFSSAEKHAFMMMLLLTASHLPARRALRGVKWLREKPILKYV
jgi:hypothetical protein